MAGFEGQKVGELIGVWLWRILVAVFVASLITNVVTIYILSQRQHENPAQTAEIERLRRGVQTLREKYDELERRKADEAVVWKTNFHVVNVQAGLVSHADRVYSDSTIPWTDKVEFYRTNTRRN